MKELIATIKSMADDARRAFASSEQWTVADEEFGAVSCATIRVPVAMLNRIDELAKTTAAPAEPQQEEGMFTIYGREEHCIILARHAHGTVDVERKSDGRTFRVSGLAKARPLADHLLNRDWIMPTDPAAGAPLDDDPHLPTIGVDAE